jgi:hypothetical protein
VCVLHVGALYCTLKWRYVGGLCEGGGDCTMLQTTRKYTPSLFDSCVTGRLCLSQDTVVRLCHFATFFSYLPQGHLSYILTLSRALYVNSD